jgi:hypothetical protein
MQPPMSTIPLTQKARLTFIYVNVMLLIVYLDAFFQC